MKNIIIKFWYLFFYNSILYALSPNLSDIIDNYYQLSRPVITDCITFRTLVINNNLYKGDLDFIIFTANSELLNDHSTYKYDADSKVDKNEKLDYNTDVVYALKNGFLYYNKLNRYHKMEWIKEWKYMGCFEPENLEIYPSIHLSNASTQKKLHLPIHIYVFYKSKGSNIDAELSKYDKLSPHDRSTKFKTLDGTHQYRLYSSSTMHEKLSLLDDVASPNIENTNQGDLKDQPSIESKTKVQSVDPQRLDSEVHFKTQNNDEVGFTNKSLNKKIDIDYATVPTPFNFSCSDLKPKEVYDISDVGKLYVSEITNLLKDQEGEFIVELDGYFIPYHYTKYYRTSSTLVKALQHQKRNQSYFRPGVYSTVDNKFYQILHDGSSFELTPRDGIIIKTDDPKFIYGSQFSDSTLNRLFQNYIGVTENNQVNAVTQCTTFLRNKKASRFSVIDFNRIKHITLDDFNTLSNGSKFNRYTQNDKETEV